MAAVLPLLAAAFSFAAPPPSPDDAAAPPETPQGSFELVEWVVLIVDPNRPNANDSAAFKSTVPGFARGRRAMADAAGSAEPSPVGVIRLLAKPGVDEGPIDVLLRVHSGRFLGSWPVGKPKNNRTLWDKVTLGDERRGKPLGVGAGHWFERLRAPDDERSSPLSIGRWSERFLLYDAEVAYPNVLRVRVGDGPLAYRLVNAGATPMRDVQVYVPAEGGWRVGGVEELPATAAQPPPTPAAPASGPEATTAPSEGAVTEVFVDGEAEQVEVVAEAAVVEQTDAELGEEAPDLPAPAQAAEAAAAAAAAATNQPAASPASTQPTSAGDDALPADAWRDVKLADDDGTKALPAADAVAAWRGRLAGAGLAPGDVDVILATLRTHALDPEQLTVVYRVDPAELDRLLPLEVVPSPAKVTRVGLAVVRNVDPAAGERIAKLIEQLGSDDWNQREAAQAKLALLGAGAAPRLTDALKHTDLEVVYRVECLLEAIKAQAAPVPPPEE